MKKYRTENWTFRVIQNLCYFHSRGKSEFEPFSIVLEMSIFINSNPISFHSMKYFFFFFWIRVVFCASWPNTEQEKADLADKWREKNSYNSWHSTSAESERILYLLFQIERGFILNCNKDWRLTIERYFMSSKQFHLWTMDTHTGFYILLGAKWLWWPRNSIRILEI